MLNARLSRRTASYIHVDINVIDRETTFFLQQNKLLYTGLLMSKLLHWRRRFKSKLVNNGGKTAQHTHQEKTAYGI